MNPCIHFTSLEQCNTILSLNFIPPSLLTTLSPFPNCHLVTFPPLRPYLPHYSPALPNLFPYSTHTPFPPCHSTPVIHLSHLPSSLLFHLSQLPSLPAANRHLQNSNLLSLSRQGKNVWLIVRRPLMKAGWWDPPLALWDLAKAISITEGSQYQILKNLPSRETNTDRRNGCLPCCSLGHLNMSVMIHLKHHIPNIKFL